MPLAGFLLQGVEKCCRRLSMRSPVERNVDQHICIE